MKDEMNTTGCALRFADDFQPFSPFSLPKTETHTHAHTNNIPNRYHVALLAVEVLRVLALRAGAEARAVGAVAVELFCWVWFWVGDGCWMGG